MSIKFTVFKSICIIIALAITKNLLFAQNNKNDLKLLDDYIQAKGYDRMITFDPSNIKQYWVDHSVSSQNENTIISLQKKGTGWESSPLRIQLANVNEALDCIIDVYSESRDFSFSIINKNSKLLSKSTAEESFLNYQRVSAIVHLDETVGFSFNFIFSSVDSTISIKKILLSFNNNKKSLYLQSPGKLQLGIDNVNIGGANDKSIKENRENKNSKNELNLTGKRTIVYSKNNLLVSDTPIQTSVRIKNTGTTPTVISVGYMAYTRDNVRLFPCHYPYKSNSKKILHVISAEKGSNIIITDSYPEWLEGCYIALNPREDLSDVPNNKFLKGAIVSVKKLDNGQGEITLSKPLDSSMDANTSIRIHGRPGSFIYTNEERVQPGMEKTYRSTIQKDDSFLEYSPKAFSRGVYYVKPVIQSYSVNNNEENTVSILDYSVLY